jgi:hypothetical protein
MASVLEVRQALADRGFTPIPVIGKAPPFKSWQKIENVSRSMLEAWGRNWPRATNTGILTRLTPTIDIDILNEPAAIAAEELARERFEERGYILPRIGKSPKRAIPFRTLDPFAKITVNLVTAGGGTGEKIEFMCDGQQIVAAGIHPDTGKPYVWPLGNPTDIAHDDLPYISQAEAKQLVDDIVELLCRDFGYSRAAERPSKARKANGQAEPAGAADWQYLYDNIIKGNALHDSLRDLAAKLITSGMDAGAAVNQLRALMEASTAPHDERWRERYAEIPRLVDSATEKYAKAPEPDPAPTGPPSTITQTLAKFDEWLLLKNQTPVLAVLGAIAANYLDGDAVWLGVVAPPSSAKTEILNATSSLPEVVQTATVTPAGLLSGTPKKQRDKGAKGGLLRQIGDFGILVLKDFGSVLSMHPETKAETLAALREVYDGSWTRHVGTDGGKTLAWTGKVGLVFAATGVIDSHHSVLGAMGDRFLLSRMAPAEGQAQFTRSLQHVGATTKQMRKELAKVVARLFAGRRAEPRPISPDEIKRIGSAISLVVRLRGAIARDRRTNEIDAIYGTEGTARVGLALERLLAGLDTLGVERAKAVEVVLSVAMDSVPPQRRAAYECVCKYGKLKTADVAIELGLPTNTARRLLEDLTAYHLLERQSLGQGHADQWVRANWEAEE